MGLSPCVFSVIIVKFLAQYPAEGNNHAYYELLRKPYQMWLTRQAITKLKTQPTEIITTISKDLSDVGVLSNSH